MALHSVGPMQQREVRGLMWKETELFRKSAVFVSGLIGEDGCVVSSLSRVTGFNPPPPPVRCTSAVIAVGHRVLHYLWGCPTLNG